MSIKDDVVDLLKSVDDYCIPRRLFNLDDGNETIECLFNDWPSFKKKLDDKNLVLSLEANLDKDLDCQTILKFKNKEDCCYLSLYGYGDEYDNRTYKFYVFVKPREITKTIYEPC